MNNNYLIYPCKTMRITQSYTGKTSHLPHTKGTLRDYPIDEGCEDSGRSSMYCPCNEMKVKRLYGVGSGGTNTLWLESTGKVDFADGTSDFFSMLVIHPDDSELKKISVGQIFKRKQEICREGKDGATGNHFHFSGGKGKLKGTGWMKNSNGKWVLTTTAHTDKPENLFYIDPIFTLVKDTRGLQFHTLPDEKEYKTGNYTVSKADLLNVRTGPGIEYKKKKFSSLTRSAQKQIIELCNGYKANGYVKGTSFTVYQVENNWGRTPSGWVCLDYCEVM